jgi:hypothetical protein
MRTRIGMCLALLFVLGTTPTTSADNTAADRFTFARPPAPESTMDPKDRLSAVIDRWSTEAERDRVAAALAEGGPAALHGALWDAPRAGTIYWPGGLEYAVRYARRLARPDGASDVVLVVDRPLWTWWDAKIGASEHPFTVVQIRLGKNGSGEGRISHGVPVAGDKTAGVVIADFVKAPALLTDVRHEPVKG